MFAQKIRDLPDRVAVMKSSLGVQSFEVAEVPDAEFGKAELRKILQWVFTNKSCYAKIDHTALDFLTEAYDSKIEDLTP